MPHITASFLLSPKPGLCIFAFKFAILHFPCLIMCLKTIINGNKGEALKTMNLSNKPWGNPYCSLFTWEEDEYSAPEKETIPTHTAAQPTGIY